MCGLAGIVSLDPGRAVDVARVERMTRVLRHRGPDGEGAVARGPVGLAHRRLAIVDVTGGAQPMANEDGSLWIVYNGEIYNHTDLRTDLVARGHPYATRSDTESILHLYEEEGERCVERLQGMFAFALWDARRGRIVLARDRLGIKPLYYAVTRDELLFASEIKAILAAGSIRPAFHTAILPEFLATRFVSGEETFFEGVRKLLPGRTLSWDPESGFRGRRYWMLPRGEETHASLEQEADRLRGELEGAVRRHLMGDVPVGLFLSGGLDSSGLAGLAAPMTGERLKTFSVGFEEAQANELGYARLAARAAGTEHREVIVRPQEFFGALPRLVWHEDEPIAFTSSVPLYLLARRAREHVKVVLTGEGADELFLGYNRYRVTAWNESLGQLYWGLVPGALRGGATRAVARLPRPARRYLQRSFVALEPSPRHLFYENFAVFPELMQRGLVLNGDGAHADPYASSLRYFDETTGDLLDRMSRADLQTYLVELLMKQDQMGMAASIESRVPFLDAAVVDHAVRLPARFKLRGWRTKAVLRAALRDVVPPAILRRRKMGFPVPIGPWLRDRHWPVVREFVLGPRALGRGLFDAAALRRLAHEHRAGAADHGDRLWLLVTLEIWQRIFIDGEDPSSIHGDPDA